MFAEPIKEIEQLRKKSMKAEPQTISDSKPATIKTDGELFDITAEFELGSAKRVGLEIGNQKVAYLVQERQLCGVVQSIITTDRNHKEPVLMDPVEGKVKIRVLVDRPTLEIFGNDGRVCITRPKPNVNDPKQHHLSSIKAYAVGGEAKLLSYEVHELKSVLNK